MAYTPSIGASGLFTLKVPFASLLLQDLLYTCSAIRTFSDFIGAGIDVYEAIYKPRELSQEVYAADVAAGVLIVTLETSGGNPLYVPTSYITGAPDIGGVPYKTILLSISLSILPESVDLTAVKAKIADDVKDMLGVDSEVMTVVASDRMVLTRVRHELVEAARQNNIATSKTDYQLLQEANAKLQVALTQNAKLSQYIKDNIPPQP